MVICDGSIICSPLVTRRHAVVEEPYVVKEPLAIATVVLQIVHGMGLEFVCATEICIFSLSEKGVVFKCGPKIALCANRNKAKVNSRGGTWLYQT
eukprot:14795468-Ditylum_brightwellii.AAC.1